jgi:hypothetical protein
MADIIEDILEYSGGSLSSEITKTLMEEYKLSYATARKRIERRSDAVGSLGYLKFARNTRFIYLKRDFGSDKYWMRLTDVMLQSNSAYGLALAALLLRNGLIPEKHFAIACGSPIKQKKHLSAETIFINLKQAGLVDKRDVPGLGSCIVLIAGPDAYDGSAAFVRARLVTESIMLNAVRDWIKKLGFGSYEKVLVRDEQPALPKVGTFAWDLSAPSFVGPMVEWQENGKPKGGFIACDIVLNGLIGPQSLAPFIHKCKTLRSLQKVGRTLQMFIALRFSKEAFILAKSNGILAATPETLFGKEVAEGLSLLLSVLTQAAKSAVNPEIFNVLFEKLAKIEGATNNLRGAFFEYLVAEIVRPKVSDVEINTILKTSDGKSTEVDVLVLTKNDTLTFIECKGYSPMATVLDEEIEIWLTKKIPLAERYARDEHPGWRNLNLKFEFWTTGKLSPNAIQMLERFKSNVRQNKYTIDYLDAAAVNKRALDSKNHSLISTLQKHYFVDPIKAAERTVKSRGGKSSISIGQELIEFRPIVESTVLTEQHSSGGLTDHSN